MKNFILGLLLAFVDQVSAQPSSLTPQLVSYISNTNLSARDVHTDCEGNIVIVGGTSSSGFSITPNTISNSYNGGNSDVFIVKKDSLGSPIWSTLLGGYLYDRAYAVEIDSAGFIYVAGRAGPNLPTTICALQQNFAGDNNPNSAYGIQDGFITKITPDGSTIVWSTYIGCDGRGFVRDIDIDSQGNIWAGISNASPNFPYITSNAVQPTATASMNPALVKISADGTTLLFGTFLSDGNSTSAGPTTVRIDKNDNVYFLSHASANNLPITKGVFQPTVAGNIDFVISKFDALGNLLFCSYLGGPAEEEVETHSLEVDTSGNVIVAGYTFGAGYPIVGNALQTSFGGVTDGVITKISADGSAILASTYLGGTLQDEIEGIGVDENNNIYLTGTAFSSNFPVTINTAYQPNKGAGSDGHITVVSPDLSTVLYGTFIGGSGADKLRTCHVDEWGKVYGAGSSGSNNFPVFNAFNNTITGSITGAAVILKPETLFQPSLTCSITNVFENPCLTTHVSYSNFPNENINVYPNPTKDLITIELSQNEYTDIYIFNTLGILMQKLSINQTFRVDLSQFPKGMYFVQLSNADKKTFKLVLQ